jgi:hypothetical protein
MSRVTSSIERSAPVMVERESWQAWPVYWTAVWVGALTSIAVALIFGLIGVAIGAHKLGTAGQILKWSRVGLGTVAWSILGSFLSFAIGGWVAASIAGIRRAEPAMLHGALSWLVALPLMILLLGIGAGNGFGGWYTGLVGAPAWVGQAMTSDPNAAIIARNAALAGVTAILLGLMGGVIGGWIGSGEPMSLAASARVAGMPRRAH